MSIRMAGLSSKMVLMLMSCTINMLTKMVIAFFTSFNKLLGLRGDGDELKNRIL